MREIKFRAWDVDNKKMILPPITQILNPTVIGFDGEVYQIQKESLENNYSEALRVSKILVKDGELVSGLVLMQYTGLKDRHGKEIFEGDIVKILYTDWPSCGGCHKTPQEHMLAIAHNAVVEWGYNGFWLTRKLGGYQEDIDPGKFGFIEIIGNIYETPELLK